jgi:hypothetical protein
MKLLIGLIGGMLLSGVLAWAGGPLFIDGIINDQVWIGFGQRTGMYTTKPGEMTALELRPHPTHPQAPGTAAEYTLYRTHDQRPGAAAEFLNILAGNGHQYDAMKQNDHQFRFGMEIANGGKHVPVFFCWEQPIAGPPADCLFRMYGGESKHRGVWVCRAEGDCKDLIKHLWRD